MTEELTEKTIGKAIDKAAEFLDKIVGPALSDIGGILSDEVRFFRIKNQVRIVQKAEHYFKSKGIEPIIVPLKILVPLLENGSLEEDESIRTKWSGLLIRASLPNTPVNFSSLWIQLLHQLSAVEVKILDNIYEHLINREIHEGLKGLTRATIYMDVEKKTVEEIRKLKNIIQADLILNNLQRLNILSFQYQRKHEDRIKSYMAKHTFYPDPEDDDKRRLYLTPLGIEFLKACRLGED